MFPDLSWSHMLLVLIVALVVVGPKDLPRLMRKMGQWTAKARNMADQFRNSFDEMARQSELDELRKELDELRNAQPLAHVERDINKALNPPSVSVTPEDGTSTEAPSVAATPAAEAMPAETVPDIDEPVPQQSEPAAPLPLPDTRPPPP